MGLSPRLRGNRQLPANYTMRLGTIPAPAGKPRWPASRTATDRDYPRACGETSGKRLWISGWQGLSPRLRGNLELMPRTFAHDGTIPAPAGKPLWRVRWLAVAGDYPRACGETAFCHTRRNSSAGLSPRLRGNHIRGLRLNGKVGTIPAPAGKPIGTNPIAPTIRDYPRACGETAFDMRRRVVHGGLSPRLRGNRDIALDVSGKLGTIPAPAGKPPS